MPIVDNIYIVYIPLLTYLFSRLNKSNSLF